MTFGPQERRPRVSRCGRVAIALLALGVAALVALPGVAARGLPDARLAIAPDGVLFVIHEGLRHRVTPQPMSYAELGAIHEGAPLAVGLVAPQDQAASSAPEARLVSAPDGVLFVIHEGVRHRVTPQPMSYAELGAIPEVAPLAVGLLAPQEEAAALPQIIVPGPGVGLSREEAIPLGRTCSCTVDRAGLISQFDITVVRVLKDAFPLIQQANRFNRPPAEGHAYVGVFVDMKYVRGPEDQPYTITPSDYRAASGDDRLRDPASVIEPEPRLRGQIYPGATLTGWIFFELRRDAPAAMAWQYSFLGERGVWFALQ